MNNKMGKFIALIALIVISQLGCASKNRSIASVEDSTELQKLIRANSQCVIDSKVTYVMNDVPDWEGIPAGFCNVPHGKAIPIATSIFPVRKKDARGSEIGDGGVFFYIIWGCYATCDQMFLKDDMTRR